MFDKNVKKRCRFEWVTASHNITVKYGACFHFHSLSKDCRANLMSVSSKRNSMSVFAVLSCHASLLANSSPPSNLTTNLRTLKLLQMMDVHMKPTHVLSACVILWLKESCRPHGLPKMIVWPPWFLWCLQGWLIQRKLTTSATGHPFTAPYQACQDSILQINETDHG